MSTGAKEQQSQSIVDNGASWRRKQIKSGELRETPLGTFFFPYLRDRRYISSPIRDAIEALGLPDVTISEAEKAAKELKIKGPLVITLLIPDRGEDSRVIPELGFGGRAFHSGFSAYFNFDPSNPHLVDSLSTRYRRIVAHELNHLARFQETHMNTLLDSLISEGLATTYEEHWDGEYLASPWGHVLGKDELMTEWERAKGELYSRRYSHNSYREWFVGRNKKHPRWSGYTLGTAIVGGYMSNHPQISMRDVVRTPSTDILNGSGFL